MATLTALSGRMDFRLDSGEIQDGRKVYRNMALGNVNGGSSADALAGVAGVIGGLCSLPVVRVTLVRTDLIGA